MKGYGQFCPVAVASEIFAERWTPLILRELLAGETRFNAIRRGVPLMSRTLLARRLRELEDAGVVETRGRAGTFVTGDQVSRAAKQAAVEYLERTAALGLDPQAALDLVRHAVDHPVRSS